MKLPTSIHTYNNYLLSSPSDAWLYFYTFFSNFQVKYQYLHAIVIHIVHFSRIGFKLPMFVYFMFAVSLVAFIYLKIEKQFTLQVCFFFCFFFCFKKNSLF